MNESLSTSDNNLSIAWARAFLRLTEPHCGEISPLSVTFRADQQGEFVEASGIREAIDAALSSIRKANCHTIANTIFPRSLWNPALPRKALFDRYNESAWPRVKRCPANSRGTYFHRMIAYENGKNEPVNQLDHIVDTWHQGNHRHSALQIAIFDPNKDHNHSRRLGFPCLHQVCFTPLGPNGAKGLSVTGFYATQHILEKAYGNYLGLLRLGQFVAHEMGLQLTQVTCIAGLAKIGNEGCMRAAALAQLRQKIQTLVSEYDRQATTEPISVS